jgi:hypothetical protein
MSDLRALSLSAVDIFHTARKPQRFQCQPLTQHSVAKRNATRSAVDTGARRMDAQELALLGTDLDEVIAERTGRTIQAVTSKRVRSKIQAFSGNPSNGRPLTKEEISQLRTARDEVIAEQIGQTTLAVKLKRCDFGIHVSVIDSGAISE